MYVIGLNAYNFMKIKTETCYTPKRIELVVTTVFYDVCYEEATLFNNYDQAVRILNQVKERKDEIFFSNSNIYGQILDVKNGYKLNVNDLKIFELVPIECSR